MSSNFLDKTGLNTLWAKIKSTFQTLGNLVTAWGSTPSDTKYPSEKLVKDSLDGKASSSHTHGNITNGGTLQTTDVTIANGDKLVVTDSSDSNKIARASIAFDGSSIGKALSQKGTWEYPKEAYLEWGGNNFTDSYGPLDASLVSELGANRFAGGNANGITVEYTRDGGTTWLDYGLTTLKKRTLFTCRGAGIVVGKATSTDKATTAENYANYKVRVIIDASAFGIYTELWKFVFYVSRNGSASCYMKMSGVSGDAPADEWTDIGEMPISGWSGYNIFNKYMRFGGTSYTRYVKLCFLFESRSAGDSRYIGLSVSTIYGYGGCGWTNPSTLAATGHLYSYNGALEALFPAKVTAPSFAGKFETARKLAVSLSNTSTDTSFDGSADVTNIKTTGTLGIANGGTGKTSAAGAANAILGEMSLSDTDIGDTNLIVFKYATPSDSRGALYSRKVTKIWDYIKGKMSSDTGVNISGNAATATSATSATNVDLTGSVKTTSTTNGDTIQVKAGSGTAAEITIVNAKHAASADSASSVAWSNVTNKTSASTSAAGIVQLQDSIGATESSTTTAATPHAVRVAIDSAVSTDTDSSTFGDNTTIATGFGSNKVHLNVASRLWTYIQDKISSVLGLTINSYGGKAAAASVADLADRANSSNSADSVNWANVTNKPATIYIGDYGTTTYSTWYSEWSAGKALFCRLSVTGGYVYYALDMIGRQNQDPITFVRAIGQGSGDFVVNGIVCNTDNSYTTIQSHIAGTTGTYTDMTVGASRVLYNTSGTKTVACSTDGFSVADTNGSKSVVIANGAVSASHGFTGNLVGNAATATNASVLIDNQDNTKTVAATSSVQTNQSDYIAVFVNNVIAKFAVSNFRAAYAERDGSGNAIASYYLPKENVVLSASGAIQYENRIGPTSGNQTLSGTGSSVSVTQNSKIMLDVTINNSGDTNAVLLMEVMSGSTSLASRIFFANVNQTVAIPYGVIYTGSSTATLTVRWSVQSGFFIGSFYTRWQVIKP